MTLDIKITKIDKSRIDSVDFKNIKFGHVYSDHMFMADYTDGVWHDPRIVPYGPMSMLPGTAVLHYSQTIFEGMKAFRNADSDVVLFRPEDNFARLNRSAERMQIPEIPKELFFEGLQELIKLDADWVSGEPEMSLYIRPFVFSADEYIGIRPASSYKFIIFTCPVGAYYAKPLRVKIETKYSRAAPGGTGAAKAGGNYGGSIHPMVEAQKAGYDQLIWTDAAEHRYIEESGTMNLIFVIDNKIVTPELNDCLLPGITRDSVLQLARSWGLEVEERRVSVDEVIAASEAGTLQEAFGVGTAVVVAPIESISHEWKDYQLPEVAEDSIAKRCAKELAQIKMGDQEDPDNWIQKIKL